MTTQTEALKLALEALEDIRDDCSGCEFEWNNDYPLQAKAHAAIKEALARPELEPVAWMDANDPNRMTAFKWENIGYHNTPLYTTPPPVTEPHKCKPWVSLSTTDIGDCIGSSDGTMGSLIRATEAKLRKLNEAPQRKPWTDEVLDLILQRSPIQANYGDLVALSRAIEAAHNIKE